MKQFVNLGKSDVEVFPIALGTNAVGGHNLWARTIRRIGWRSC